MRISRSVLVLLLVWAIAGASPALAVQQLHEVDGMPFSLEAHHKLAVKLLGRDDPAALSAALVMPHDLTGLDVISINWPAGGDTRLALGQTGAKRGSPREQLYTVLAYSMGEDNKTELLDPPGKPLAGTVNRLALWPTADRQQLILLYTMAATGAADSPVYAYALAATGQARKLSTGGALSAYGGFEAVDLDDDGSFELLTTRNLDGMQGGFVYHAVRRLEGDSFIADPERYKPYFTDELTFLDWVVATRGQIEATPENYVNKGLYGFFYAAEYHGALFGFDSIVEINGDGTPNNMTAYNKLRREAFGRVSAYRDELKAWLGGGPRPPTWKLAR
jgi:hypothetical protein